MNVLKAKCDSELAIGKDKNGDLLIQLKMVGLPGMVTDLILAKGDDLGAKLITAIMDVIGASSIRTNGDGVAKFLTPAIQPEDDEQHVIH